ncbi:MAG TPA: c-type cytochrome [Rhodocyclaceae bacterium]
MRHTLFFVAAISASLLVGCSSIERSRNLASPEVSGKTLAEQVCSSCHGLTGNSESPNFPKLAGQQRDYLLAQLTQFRSHNRADPAGFEYMWGLSRSLSDKQIGELASYYAASAPTSGPAGNPQMISAGEKIFNGGVSDKGVPACASCHGPKGEGAAAFPRLAGQHADYLIKQLLVFQRTNERPEGSVMKTVAHGLSADDIQAVASFAQQM